MCATLRFGIPDKQLVPHKGPGHIRTGGEQAVILQNQRMILLAHGTGQRILLGLVKDNAVEVVIADPLEQLTAFLHHRHHLYIQRGNRLAEGLMRVHHAMQVIRARLVNGGMDHIAGSVQPGVVRHLVAVKIDTGQVRGGDLVIGQSERIDQERIGSGTRSVM